MQDGPSGVHTQADPGLQSPALAQPPHRPLMQRLNGHCGSASVAQTMPTDGESSVGAVFVA